MGLESGTYISDLSITNPTGTDYIAQADDHIRLLKSVLQNTFPNITGAMTTTHTQLNQAVVPIGGVIMWTGAPGSLPTGWKLCDGGTYTRTDGGGNITVPDLRNKFVMGCGGSTATPTAAPTIGTTGGATSQATAVSIAAYALTQNDLPNCSFPVTEVAHTHTATSVVTDPGHSHGLALTGFTSGAYNAAYATGSNISTTAAVTGITVATTNATAKTNLTVASGGLGTAHNHTVTQSTINTVPPYYTLAFICKV